MSHPHALDMYFNFKFHKGNNGSQAFRKCIPYFYTPRNVYHLYFYKDVEHVIMYIAYFTPFNAYRSAKHTPVTY